MPGVPDRHVQAGAGYTGWQSGEAGEEAVIGFEGRLAVGGLVL